MFLVLFARILIVHDIQSKEASFLTTFAKGLPLDIYVPSYKNQHTTFFTDVVINPKLVEYTDDGPVYSYLLCNVERKCDWDELLAQIQVSATLRGNPLTPLELQCLWPTPNDLHTGKYVIEEDQDDVFIINTKYYFK